MNKILSLLFVFSFISAPVMAWDEGGCSFSKKNKESQEANIEKVEKPDYSKK